MTFSTRGNPLLCFYPFQVTVNWLGTGIFLPTTQRIMEYNILEKDIENAIFKGQLLKKYGIKVVAQQVRSVNKTVKRSDKSKSYSHDMDGIIDLIGYHNKSKTWIIIEVKRGVLDASAYTQLSRYISSAKRLADDFYCCGRAIRPKVAGLLIGGSWTNDLEFLDELDGWLPDVPIAPECFFEYHPITKLIFRVETKLEVSI